MGLAINRRPTGRKWGRPKGSRKLPISAEVGSAAYYREYRRLRKSGK